MTIRTRLERLEVVLAGGDGPSWDEKSAADRVLSAHLLAKLESMAIGQAWPADPPNVAAAREVVRRWNMANGIPEMTRADADASWARLKQKLERIFDAAQANS